MDTRKALEPRMDGTALQHSLWRIEALREALTDIASGDDGWQHSVASNALIVDDGNAALSAPQPDPVGEIVAWLRAHHNPGEILKAKTLPYLVIADEISRRFGSGNGGWMPTHRHLKTGGLYRVIARGRIEADLTPAVIYANKDGETWVRPEAEFNDGRFEALPPGAIP